MNRNFLILEEDRQFITVEGRAERFDAELNSGLKLFESSHSWFHFERIHEASFFYSTAYDLWYERADGQLWKVGTLTLAHVVVGVNLTLETARFIDAEQGTEYLVDFLSILRRVVDKFDPGEQPPTVSLLEAGVQYSESPETQGEKHDSGDKKRKVGDRVRKRAEVIKGIKDKHPDWSQAKVAQVAAHTLEDDTINVDTVRNDYNAMGWCWERADRIR